MDSRVDGARVAQTAGLVEQHRGLLRACKVAAAHLGGLLFGYFLFGRARESDQLSGCPRRSYEDHETRELVRFVPVGTDTDIDQERDRELRNTGH